MSRIRLEPGVLGRLICAVGALVVLALSNTASAADAGQALPINIQADNANFTQKTGVSTYTGDVRMTRGGLTLTGHKLVVTRIGERSRIQAVLTGQPARINKQPDAADNENVQGHAQRIEYINGTSIITLRGNAEVTREGDRIRGATITHNIDTGETHAERGNANDERVHITIQPRNDSS